MRVNGTSSLGILQTLADNLAMEADSVKRLKALVTLDHDWRRLMVAARDEAAYEARQKWTREDIGQMTGYSPQQIAYWANRHRQRTGAPPLKPRIGIDLSSAIDLTHRGVLGE